MQTPVRRHRRHSDIFIVGFEHISYIFLKFLLLTLSMYLLAGFLPYFNMCGQAFSNYQVSITYFLGCQHACKNHNEPFITSRDMAKPCNFIG